MQQKSLSEKMLSYIIPVFLFAVLITVGMGYVLGYRAIIVNGWSAEPHISYQSVIIIHKPKFEELRIGDFVTFTNSGKSYITHQITEIDYETDTIVCQGWHYNSETGQYEHQSDKQTMKYKNIVGKVIYSNYIVGKTICILRDNKVLLVGIIGFFALFIMLKKEWSIEPKFK